MLALHQSVWPPNLPFPPWSTIPKTNSLIIQLSCLNSRNILCICISVWSAFVVTFRGTTIIHPDQTTNASDGTLSVGHRLLECIVEQTTVNQRQLQSRPVLEMIPAVLRCSQWERAETKESVPCWTSTQVYVETSNVAPQIMSWRQQTMPTTFNRQRQLANYLKNYSNKQPMGYEAQLAAQQYRHFLWWPMKWTRPVWPT